MPKHPTKSSSSAGSGGGNSTTPPGSSSTLGTGDHAVAGARMESMPSITRTVPGMKQPGMTTPPGFDHMP